MQASLVLKILTTVGTSITETGADSWLNLGTERVYESNDKTTTYVPVHVSSNADIVTSQITKNDDLDDSKIYDADDSTVFINNYSKDVVRRAIVSGKTEHVLVSADDTEHKVGKKTSGKSVGSNRTILSVKKGATVKVRVKAYYYDANGLKHVGKYSKWVTKKTDKK